MNGSQYALSNGLKWFFGIFFFSLMAVVVIMIVTFRSSSAIVQERVAGTALEAINQSAKQTDQYVSNFVGIAKQIHVNPLIQEDLRVYFKRPVVWQEQHDAKLRVSKLLSNFRDANRDSIYSIALFPKIGYEQTSAANDMNDSILHSTAGPTMRFDEQSIRRTERILAADGEVVWFPSEQGGFFGFSYMPTYAFGVLLKNLQAPEQEMILLMELKQSALFEPLGALSLGEGSGAFMADAKGNYVAAPDPNWLGVTATYANAAKATIVNNNPQIRIMKGVDDQPYLVLNALSNVTGWTVYGYLPVSELVGPMEELFVWSIAAAMFMLIVLILAAVLGRRFSGMYRKMLQFNDEIQKKNEQLSRMDKMKDQILANTSHELRTPLNGIIGLAESLADGATGKLSDATKYNLGMIMSSGRRLLNLVNDILDFSKLRSHEIELHNQPIDLRELVDLVLTMFMPLSEQKKIGLVNAVPEKLPATWADPNRLQQIFYNLVGNAVKFTQQGEVTVSARSIGDRVVILVRDTGIGIPPEVQGRIFESFEQGDGEASRVQGGTGLGLAVTKTLVELHGGEINVTSMPGFGSTFTFTMPLTDLPAVQLTEAMGQYALSKANVEMPNLIPLNLDENQRQQRIHDCRVLIVDDEPINLQVLENHLMLNQYEVIQASSGMDALKWLETNLRPDLVILDVMMPVMTGFDVCRSIREKYSSSDLPVILLTAKNQVHDLTTGFMVGANDYLVKPFTKQELLARVHLHVQLARWSRMLEEQVKQRTTDLQMLLDQSGQGFLSIGSDLLVEPKYSAECTRLFRGEIEGCSIVDLLFPHDMIQQVSMPEIFAEMFLATDAAKRNLIMNLLPNELSIYKTTVQIGYKCIESDDGKLLKIMLVLTDQTQRLELEKKIDQERQYLLMIVKATTHQHDVLALMDTYKEFANQHFEQWIPDHDSGIPEKFNQLMRIVHTFKGNFSQIQFVRTPEQLHELESELTALFHQPQLTVSRWAAFLSKINWLKFVQADMKRIDDSLGSAYWVKSRTVSVDPVHLRLLEKEVKSVFQVDDSHTIIKSLRKLYYVPIQQLIIVHESSTMELAGRIGKSMHRFQFSGDAVMVDHDLFRPWQDAVVHLLRNSLDHGIEAFDERILAGKHGAGLISCRVAVHADTVQLFIEDDGQGLSARMLRRKMIERGICSEEMASEMTQEEVFDVIFKPSFSIRDRVSELSGRGIGLNVVREVTEQMGGTVHVESEYRKFTRFVFQFPRHMVMTLMDELHAPKRALQAGK